MKNLFTALLFHFQQLECQRHKCDSCGKSFTDLGYLKKHVKAQHEGQQMQKCEFCAKSFSALKTHIKIVHDGNKDQNCEICGKSFSIKGHLKRHIRTKHDRKIAL